MATVHELSRTDARRIAVRAQLLTKERPTDLLETVRRLSLLQLDPTSAVAPSADLVLWSRLGSAYSPQELRDAVDEQPLIELRGTLRPAEDIALYRAEMAEWPGAGELRDWQEYRRDWVMTNNACRRDILERLRADGPLPDERAARHLREALGLERLEQQQERHDDARLPRRSAARSRSPAGRAATGSGTSPPASTPTTRSLPSDEARRLRDERRLGALGIARSRGPECPVEPLDVGEAGEPAVVEGVRGQWRVDPAQLGQPFAGRAALLSPFDRLLHDRKRMNDVFEFDYHLEMYKPAAKRRWGYYALPILYGDRLVGKLDAKADRKAGVLRVAAVHRDVPFSNAMTAAVDREIKDLARWLDLELVLPED